VDDLQTRHFQVNGSSDWSGSKQQEKKGEKDGRKAEKTCKREIEYLASAANRTRGPSMATMDFTTKPLTLDEIQTKISTRGMDAEPGYANQRGPIVH